MHSGTSGSLGFVEPTIGGREQVFQFDAIFWIHRDTRQERDPDQVLQTRDEMPIGEYL